MTTENSAAPAAAPSNESAAPVVVARSNSQLTGGDQAAIAATAVAAGELPGDWLKADQRAEWMQERFYDAEKKGFRVPELAKAYSEAEKKLFTRTDDLKRQVEREFNETRLAQRPEAPEKYEAKLPKEFALPDGATYTPDEKDPMMQFWRKTAHEMGLNQEQFENGIGVYMQSLEHNAPNIEAEFKKLGENGVQRVERVQTWIGSKLGEKHVKALAPFVTSADAVEAMEAMMAAAQGMAMAPNTPTPPITIQSASELREMMTDPRYWDANRRDPAWVKKIEDGWKRIAS
jgi:hypothetical protein